MIIHLRGDVIELKGSLVENHWTALKSAVSLLLDQHPSGAIIDCSRLTDINEAGAHTFLDASSYIESQHARVVLAGLPEHILGEIRQIPGARSQLPLAASIEEARASLAVGGEEAVPENKRKPAIMVPLLGSWPQALDFAAVQAARQMEIHLVYVIEVPRNLPLGVPLPEKEREATQVLSEAERSLSRTGLTVRKLTTRARVASEGAGNFASDAAPRLVIAAYPKAELLKEAGRQDIMGELCSHAPNDVAILCIEEPSIGEEPRELCKPVVLVPLIGSWPRALEYAAVYAAARKIEIHLLYVLEVSRKLPMDIPLPEKEQEAQTTLAEAERILKRKGVVMRKLTTRVRDALEGAARFAKEAKPQLLLVAYHKDDLADQAIRYEILDTFCRESPCDVAICCTAE